MDIIAFRINYEKQWRHSYKSSYVLFKTKYFESSTRIDSDQTHIDDIEDVWFFSFEPRPSGLSINEKPRRKFVYVTESNNLFYGNVGGDGKTNIKEMPNGNDATPENGILNGVPDWVYEEEMLSFRAFPYYMGHISLVTV